MAARRGYRCVSCCVVSVVPSTPDRDFTGERGRLGSCLSARASRSDDDARDLRRTYEAEAGQSWLVAQSASHVSPHALARDYRSDCALVVLASSVLIARASVLHVLRTACVTRVSATSARWPACRIFLQAKRYRAPCAHSPKQHEHWLKSTQWPSPQCRLAWDIESYDVITPQKEKETHFTCPGRRAPCGEMF